MLSRKVHFRLLASTAVLTSFLFSPSYLFAQDGAIALDKITVTTILDSISDATTKTDEKIVDTLAGTSVVTETELKQFQPGRPSDVLAAVPGLDVQEDSDDPGSAINIRGLQDFGRVNVMIDGARQNFQRSGHNADGQFYLEPELIRQVDIVRGPVSTIYGSGAIGGVVNFETIDPIDMLRHSQTWAAQVKGQYNTNDEGKLVSATGAVKLMQNVSFLGNIVWRDNDNYEDGDGNLIPNSGEEILTGLAKTVIDFAPGNQLKLSYLDQKNDYITGQVDDQRETEAKDRTITGKWLFNPAQNDLIDLSASVYFTDTEIDQNRLDGALAGNQRNFTIETIGTDVFNSSRFHSGLVTHTITYGGDYFKDEVDVKDQAQRAQLFTPSGEREAYGFFIQDKIEYSTWLELIGAMRYDNFSLQSADGRIDTQGDRFSPKFTVGVKPFENLQLFATYAEGYRAPSITETMIDGLHPPPASFAFVPNPFLTPETSHNLEGGVNLSFDNVLKSNDKFQAKVVYFHNKVDDFIDQQFESGFGRFGPVPTSCGNTVGCFSYANIAEAFLRGFEVEASYDAKDWFAHLSYTHVRGDNQQDGTPLLSVFPEKVVATIGVRLMEEKLVIGGRWTGVAAQDRVPIGALASESYNLFDLFATYDVTDNFSAGLTLKNITDEQYTRYLNLESDAEPGFSALISGTIRFGG